MFISCTPREKSSIAVLSPRLTGVILHGMVITVSLFIVDVYETRP